MIDINDQLIQLPIANSEAERPKRSDAVANRQLILQTAKRLFRDVGIDDVSMSQIAREAGIGKGTLYRAVANKGELCLALMDEDLRNFQNDMFAMFAAMPHSSAVERLNNFLDRCVHFFDDHAPLICEAQTHGVTIAMRGEINQTSLHGWFHQTVTALLRRAQQEGDVVTEHDPAYLADLILAPLNPRLFSYQRSVANYSLEQISSGLRHFVLHGISPNR